MASQEQVKFYLAYWFQLGKRVVFYQEGVAITPEPIFTINQYSATFENCWRQLIAPENRQSYLEGTLQTIEELLSSQWDIVPCARCSMPIPLMEIGTSFGNCPCNDLAVFSIPQLKIREDLEKETLDDVAPRKS